ncbi:hypothetical protein ElyMa_000690800, partial [Elysia marginata]
VARLLVGVAALVILAGAQETTIQKDFIVECIRPLGIRVTPSPDFRIIQTGCRGPDINVALEAPYDVSPDCLVVTATGTHENLQKVTFLIASRSKQKMVISTWAGDYFLYTPEALIFPNPHLVMAIGLPREGLDPTATSGVFKFTGQAFIIPRECRVKPATGNFTTIWHHDSKQERCLEVSGISRNPVRVFSDVSSATDVMSLQFYGFQFLGYEQEVITFECDVLLCGDITTGSCGETIYQTTYLSFHRPSNFLQEWTKLVVEKICVTNKLPPLPRPTPTDPPGKEGRRRRRQALELNHGNISSDNSNNYIHNNNMNLSSNSSDGNNKNNNITPAPGNKNSSNNNKTLFRNINNNMDNNDADDNSNNNNNGIKTASPSSSSKPSIDSPDMYSSGSSSSRGVVQEETVRVEIRMLMPRAKLTHMGSGKL